MPIRNEQTKEVLKQFKLLDRDTNFINMGTYNYGNDGVSHTFKDVKFIIPNDNLDKTEKEKANLNQEKIRDYIERIE